MGTARTLPDFLCCSVYCLFCVMFVCKCVLYSTVQYCSVLYCAVLYCTVLYYCHRVATQSQLTKCIIFFFFFYCRYNPLSVLAFSVIFFHSTLSLHKFLHPLIPIICKSSSMSSIHLFLGLPLFLLPVGFHSSTLLGILFPYIHIT